MIPYVVKQGDYLAKIAFHLRVNAEEVWNHPRNRALKDQRRDPNILRPGDILFVPPSAPVAPSVTMGAENRFVGEVPEVTIHLRLVGPRNQPHAGEPCTIDGLPEPLHLTTDADGNLSFTVPVTVSLLRVTLDDHGVGVDAWIGALDPHDEASGRDMRLGNLGFQPHAPDVEAPERQLDEALKAFQSMHGEPTDYPDPWAQVTDVHGC